MAAWHRRYNVSGTIHCGGRVDDWCCVLRKVLQTDNVGAIGHFTGEFSVMGFSPVADVVSSGGEVHDMWALCPGRRADWERFAQSLGTVLQAADLSFSLVVHDVVLSRH